MGILFGILAVIVLIMLAAVALYLILAVSYGLFASRFYQKKHIRAKQRMKRYMRDLSRLEKMNLKKEIHRS